MKIPLKKTIRLESEISGGFLEEPLAKGEKPFSTANTIVNASHEHVQQVRNWKNRVIEIRDLYKGTDSYEKWDEEAKRIVAFLNKFTYTT